MGGIGVDRDQCSGCCCVYPRYPLQDYSAFYQLQEQVLAADNSMVKTFSGSSPWLKEVAIWRPFLLGESWHQITDPCCYKSFHSGWLWCAICGLMLPMVSAETLLQWHHDWTSSAQSCDTHCSQAVTSEHSSVVVLHANLPSLSLCLTDCNPSQPSNQKSTGSWQHETAALAVDTRERSRLIEILKS